MWIGSDAIRACRLSFNSMYVQVQLLTELHWSLPHPLTQAELAFKQQELPALEDAVQTLKQSLKVGTFLANQA